MPATFPVSRLALEMRDGEYDNFVFANQVGNTVQKLKARLAMKPRIYH